MSLMRPEVLAFIRAAQGLFSIEAQATSLPLSDHETEKIVDCMAKLEQMLLDGDLTRVDGDGHPHGDGHPDGDGHP